MKALLIYILMSLFCFITVQGQPVPSLDEKIPYLVTFGKKADKKWGDDDNLQIFFFVVPEKYSSPVYIRIFDPETGGKNDEMKGKFDSKIKFTVYGGLGAHSSKDAKTINAIGNFRTGTQLVTKTFGVDTALDNKWLSLGPFNPSEGELQNDYGGRVFKIVIEGIDGDDGNIYSMYLSSDQDKNIAIEGGNAFSYEYTFRLPEKVGSVSHLYPFIPANVISVKINVYDYDNEGKIRVVTIARKGEVFSSNKDQIWDSTKIVIVKEELNTSMDVQFIKKKETKNNNIAVYITNQFNEVLPFYTVPIGGIPKFKYKIGIKEIK